MRPRRPGQEGIWPAAAWRLACQEGGGAHHHEQSGRAAGTFNIVAEGAGKLRSARSRRNAGVEVRSWSADLEDKSGNLRLRCQTEEYVDMVAKWHHRPAKGGRTACRTLPPCRPFGPTTEAMSAEMAKEPARRRRREAAAWVRMGGMGVLKNLCSRKTMQKAPPGGLPFWRMPHRFAT